MVLLLSRWFQKNARRLPWRETRDPYAIWISEVMLQQTQVATVIPYYERFLAAFPTVEALANAPEEKVLSIWAGLGYYSRARNLREGARQITRDYQGIFPRTRDEILKIKGVGPYTAGAILSIAFDLTVPLVDGNVQRVFSRYFGKRDPIDQKKAQTFFWTQAEALVGQAKSPRVFNQALMELGATICTKGEPLCKRCPIQASCVAFAKGWQKDLPVKAKKTVYQDLQWTVLVLEHGGKIALKQNGAGEWWHGLWDFPRYDGNDVSLCGVSEKELENYRALNYQKHTVTHHRITIAPYHIRLRKRPRKKQLAWYDKSEINELPLSALAKKILQSL